jgi:biopolymer transport protein ExbB/TolQ
MTQVLTPFDSLLMTIVLVTLATGMPILVILAIRVLWNRNLYLGRSKELEKLIWQLHRIASAMEHQMNLSFPAVQPGTEDASDLAYLQQPAAQAKADTPSVATPSPLLRAQEPAAQQPATSEQPAQQSAFPPLVPRESSAEPQRHGVNSMFGL